METTTLDYLIPYVRLRLGDLDSTNYRYTDDWILTALLGAVEYLGRWWNLRYLIEYTTNEVYRNQSGSFIFPEPPVIQPQDNQIIVLVATLITLEGSLENAAWNFVSWRDNEISYSNLEQSRTKNQNVNRLWEELLSLITPPTKKLARAIKNSLPGYKFNQFERDIKDP